MALTLQLISLSLSVINVKRIDHRERTTISNNKLLKLPKLTSVVPARVTGTSSGSTSSTSASTAQSLFLCWKRRRSQSMQPLYAGGDCRRARVDRSRGVVSQAKQSRWSSISRRGGTRSRQRPCATEKVKLLADTVATRLEII